MTELLHRWVCGLTAAAVLSVGAQLLTPRGPGEKATRFVCGLILMTVLLSPLSEIGSGQPAWSLSDYRETVSELTEELEHQQNELVMPYIESQYAAYILDEADNLAVTVEAAEVSVRWGDDAWIPYSVHLKAETTSEQRIILSQWIEIQLGIPAERQIWTE